MGSTAATLGAAGIIGGLGFLGAREQAEAARAAAQPLPTYYQHVMTPQQEALWSGLGGGMGGGLLSNMMMGQMPQAQAAQINFPEPTLQAVPGAQPTAGWYSGLDPNVRAGIEEPYMRGMDILEERMAGRGLLGSPRAGISGAAADVLGEYMQQAAPSMAQTAWGMMQPGMIEAQRQGWLAQTMPYQAGVQGALQQAGLEQQTGLANLQSAMLPYMQLPQYLQLAQPTTLVGHTPTIQQIQPGAAMPPEYQNQITALQEQLARSQRKQEEDRWLWEGGP